ISTEEAFDGPATLRRLAIASGGYVRALLTLATEALSGVDVLPITADAVEAAIRRTRDLRVRSIPTQEDWARLRRVAATRDIERTAEFLPLLENFSVLEYLDEEGSWYNV